MRRATLLALAFAALTGCGSEEDSEEPPPEAAEERWQVHYAATEAGESHPNTVLLTRRATGEGTARLVVGCDEGTTVAYVEWGALLGAAEVAVTHRVDDEPEQTARWRTSDDRGATGLWVDSLSVPFIRALLGRQRLTARVTPGEGRPITRAFALDSLDTLAGQLQAECRWP